MMKLFVFIMPLLTTAVMIRSDGCFFTFCAYIHLYNSKKHYLCTYLPQYQKIPHKKSV